MQVAFHVHLAGIFRGALAGFRIGTGAALRPCPGGGQKRKRVEAVARLCIGTSYNDSPKPACSGKVRLRDSEGLRSDPRNHGVSVVLGSPLIKHHSASCWGVWPSAKKSSMDIRDEHPPEARFGWCRTSIRSDPGSRTKYQQSPFELRYTSRSGGGRAPSETLAAGLARSASRSY